jgi:ATP-dependent DNA helicase RecQ
VLVAERKSKYVRTEIMQGYVRDLFDELKRLRLIISREENVPPYIIFSDTTLIELATFLPFHNDELQQISGFGKIKVEKYGKEFLNSIKMFCEERGIESRMQDKVPSSSVILLKQTGSAGMSATKKQSFEMFSSGMPISEIAKNRKLTEGTVTHHLLHFVGLGQINILKFVTKEKLAAISKMIDEHGSSDLTNLKNLLGEKYSYTEIKAVIQYRQKKENGAIK